ncbi:hypothetical protein ACJ41O_012875 [Fusarium nematophilum]
MGVHNVFTQVYLLGHKDEFKERIKNNKVVAVEFYGTKSVECKAIAPAFAHSSKLDKFKGFLFVNVDVDHVPDLAQELGVDSVPAFQLYKGEQKVAESQGPEEEKLIKLLEAGL